PIEFAIQSWLDILPTELLARLTTGQRESLLFNAPKRWVVYPPMVLLPSGSFKHHWWAASPFSQHIDDLWRIILESITKKEGKGLLTHLAINAGIPLNGRTDGDGENILRTPSGLLTLYGDFGPALDPAHCPSEKDFKEAFWASTKQNGITQIWAPRYTMFSRGNVKEKARLSNFHQCDGSWPSRRRSRNQLRNEVAVDMYAGIGYFVFSYKKMGLRRVFGWELNPWSVEGLRRGAVANGWSVKIINETEFLDFEDEDIVVMLEDNSRASVRLKEAHKEEALDIRHVNCGLLPSSRKSWESALGMVKGDAWLHLHENVGVNDISVRMVEIEDHLRFLLKNGNDPREFKAEHAELVKTFAPGVWHCVFDIYI
ncbi:S-adenosyl-L-methionine-dependent methyltransferase, partial [Bisporella sp. PMI_857]